MQSLERVLDRLALLLMVFGGVAMLLMMLQIMVEVVLRTFLKVTIPGTEETVSAYYMIACAFLPLAWVQRSRGHVKVEVFTLWMSPRLAAGFDAVVMLLCAAVTAVFAYATIGKAIEMTRGNEILIGAIDVVVWPSRWMVPVGLLAMMGFMIAQSWADLVWAIRGGTRHLAPQPNVL